MNDQSGKHLFVFGTRPEIIKLYPVIRAFKNRGMGRSIGVCFTGQHDELARGLLRTFEMTPDFDLSVMEPGQNLNQLAGKLLVEIDRVLDSFSPDWVIAQGDTTSVWASAVASFHRRIPFAHVEAGLRSFDLEDPFPEEFNRLIVAQAARLHFAPTPSAKENLVAEGVDEAAVRVVGNTVIDTLFLTLDRLRPDFPLAPRLDPSKRWILVTLHRRENQGRPIEDLCRILLQTAEENEDVQVVFPVHCNPGVRKTVFSTLRTPRARAAGVHVMDPPDYEAFVHLLKRSWLIVTDSGGIQEEAPSLNKPLLILRNRTERPECVEVGAAKLIGNSSHALRRQLNALIRNPGLYDSMCNRPNPFGDGRAAERIVDCLTGENLDACFSPALPHALQAIP